MKVYLENDEHAGEFLSRPGYRRSVAFASEEDGPTPLRSGRKPLSGFNRQPQGVGSPLYESMRKGGLFRSATPGLVNHNSSNMNASLLNGSILKTPKLTPIRNNPGSMMQYKENATPAATALSAILLSPSASSHQSLVGINSPEWKEKQERGSNLQDGIPRPHPPIQQQQTQQQDPPEEDSKVWLSPKASQRERALDPEASQIMKDVSIAPWKADESVLMGTNHPDVDLVRRSTERDVSHLTTHLDESSYDDREVTFSEERSYQIRTPSHSQNINNTSLGSISYLRSGIPPTPIPSPAFVKFLREMEDDDEEGEEAELRPRVLRESQIEAIREHFQEDGPQAINELLPRSPREAKEWLQKAVDTLQDARSERESARQWAHDMKDAVNRWVEEQRKLVECEAETRMEGLAEREQQFRNQAETLAKMEASLKALHTQFQSVHETRKASESRLQQLILDQHDQIHGLSRQLSSMEQTVSEGVSIQQRLTPTSSSSSMPAVSDGSKRQESAFPRFVDRPQSNNPEDGRRDIPGSNASQASTSSNRVKRPLPGGGYVVIYSNGVQKEVHKDGTTVVRFSNGDVETTFTQSGTVAYFHASDQVLQISTPNGTVLYEYPNHQIERHFPDGSKAILFPDGTKAKISADGKLETYQRI